MQMAMEPTTTGGKGRALPTSTARRAKVSKTKPDARRDAAERVNYRVQLELSRDSYKLLEHMRDTSGVKSLAPVVRDALRVYEWYLSRKRDGYRLQLVKGGEIIPVDLMI